MKEYVKILSDTRIAKGLDISEVSRKTGIRQSVLEAIESGEFPDLPIVYIRSFIKKYATFLELEESDYSDLSEALHKLLEKEKLTHKPIATDKSSSIDPSDRNVIAIIKSGKYKDLISDKRIVSSIMYLGLGLVIVSIIYFVFFSGGSDLKETTNNVAINQEINSSEEEAEEENLMNYFNTTDSLVLEIFALDESWISITIDGKVNEELLLKPGTKKIWKAAKYFTLTSGNAGGIQLKRNGKKLEPLGARGNVVSNVKITKDEVTK